jgi:hypothetical protein
VWYLAIQNIPIVQQVFGHFLEFAIATSVVGTVAAIVIGYVHLKRSPAYSSEADIGVESNPYYYKLPPGFNREVFAPMYFELLVLMQKILEGRPLGDEDKARIEKLKEKLKLLESGGAVGSERFAKQN